MQRTKENHSYSERELSLARTGSPSWHKACSKWDVGKNERLCTEKVLVSLAALERIPQHQLERAIKRVMKESRSLQVEKEAVRCLSENGTAFQIKHLDPDRFLILLDSEAN